MLNVVFGIFVILHGLVHLWYVTLSQQLVEYRPDMGWTGESWLLSPAVGSGILRPVSSILFGLSMLGLLVGGVGLLAGGGWWRPLLLIAAGVSFVTILIFWDGRPQMLVQKGLAGLLIDAAIILVILFTSR